MKSFALFIVCMQIFCAQDIIFTIATCNMLKNGLYLKYAAQSLSGDELLTPAQRRTFFTELFNDVLSDADIICFQEWDPFIVQYQNKTPRYPRSFITSVVGTQARDIDCALLVNSTTFLLPSDKSIPLHLVVPKMGETPVMRGQALTIAPKSAPDRAIRIINCHIPWRTLSELPQQIKDMNTIVEQGTAPENIPTIVCGDFNFNTYHTDNDNRSTYIPKDLASPSSHESHARPYHALETVFPPRRWHDAGLMVAGSVQKTLPTSYMEGFERNDYIFYTTDDLTLLSFEIYPHDLKHLVKHRRRTGYDPMIDGPVSDGYFSDHAIVKATFKLTSVSEKLKELAHQLNVLTQELSV